MDYRSIITLEPGKRSGKPTIRGLRVTVYNVLDYLASGMTPDEILKDFPYLTREDIQACLSFAADRERKVTVVLANEARWNTARNVGGETMIRNDQELAVMRERVAKIEHLLETLRKTATPEEWPALSSGYRLEIERMQGEILDYLVQGAPRRSEGATA